MNIQLQRDTAFAIAALASLLESLLASRFAEASRCIVPR